MHHATDSEPTWLSHDAPRSSHETVRKLLLACGVLYSLLYVLVNDVVAASLYDGYSRVSQAVSELSATGSPTQRFLFVLAPLFNGLMIAFGVGVWRSAGRRWTLRVVGVLLMAHGLTAFLWLLGPMSQRAEIAAHGGGSGDLLHLVLSGASMLFILSQVGFGAAAFGRTFRLFSAAMIVAFLVFGAATGVMSRDLAIGEPTPLLGLVERVMLGAWLLWMIVLAMALMPGAWAGTPQRIAPASRLAGAVRSR